jgi:cytochrome c peroxidase
MKKNWYKYFCLFIFFLTISCNQNSKYFYFSTEKEFIENNKYLSDTAKLGKLLFFDKNLSEPAGISCASCHSPNFGFSDARQIPFSFGVNPLHGTERNSIAISYNILAPSRQSANLRGIKETIGGHFWDGRAKVLEAQAFSPLLNANEMNNKDIAQLTKKIRNSNYFKEYHKIFGSEALQDDQVLMLFSSQALKSFQTSYQVNPYTSKFDFFILGKVKLTEQEFRGWKLFQDTTKSKCSICHLVTKSEFTNSIVFTDFSYENIGIPKHPTQKKLPIDSGFAKSEFVINPLEIGRFKTPSLRNVAITKPYMHNGIFNTLEEVLDFYNTRDINSKFIPEYKATMNTEDLGNLNLSKSEIKDIIAFLETLTDGYKLEQKKN